MDLISRDPFRHCDAPSPGPARGRGYTGRHRAPAPVPEPRPRGEFRLAWPGPITYRAVNFTWR